MTTPILLAQSFARLYNLPVPNVLVGSTDAGVLQLMEVINKLGKDIARQGNWQVQSRRATWISIQGEDQGTVDSLMPDNCDHIVPRTFWDDTLRRPIFGPVGDTDWQMLKAFVPGTPLYQFKIMDNRVLIYGPMIAGHQLSTIYQTKNWLKVAGTDPQEYADVITSDDDEIVFPEDILDLGMEYMWRRVKKMDYLDEKAVYEAACMATLSKDNVQPVLHMDEPDQTLTPGIWVPAGNWPTTPSS